MYMYLLTYHRTLQLPVPLYSMLPIYFWIRTYLPLITYLLPT